MTYTIDLTSRCGICYYIDESGHSGDLIKSGNALDFYGQPIFSLACIGVNDEIRLNKEIERLASKHRIASTELKSTLLKNKPSFILDIVEFVCGEQMPFFIEVVDKKFFLCAEIINCHVLPPSAGVESDSLSWLVRNRFADYLYDRAPNLVFEKFIAACTNPCNQSLLESFQIILSLTEFDKTISEEAMGIHMHMVETLDDYESMKKDNENAYLKFLPLPDDSKFSKPIWILPNLSSFCNIYARINLFHAGDLTGVRLIHDEQKHLDEILENAKRSAESLLKNGTRAFTPHANYNFTQSAPLTFAESGRSSGIQAADILAGLVMRYFKERVSNSGSVNPQIHTAFARLLTYSDPAGAVGVNLVVPSKFAGLSALS